MKRMRKELHLSDAFDLPVEKGKFEWTATMININHGMNAELIKHWNKLASRAGSMEEFLLHIKRQ